MVSRAVSVCWIFREVAKLWAAVKELDLSYHKKDVYRTPNNGVSELWQFNLSSSTATQTLGSRRLVTVCTEACQSPAAAEGEGACWPLLEPRVDMNARCQMGSSEPWSSNERGTRWGLCSPRKASRDRNPGLHALSVLLGLGKSCF